MSVPVNSILRVCVHTAEGEPFSLNGGLRRNRLYPASVDNRDIMLRLISFCSFFFFPPPVLRTWCFLLLYAFIPSRTSCCIQILNRKSGKMVRTGKVSRDAEIYDV